MFQHGNLYTYTRINFTNVMEIFPAFGKPLQAFNPKRIDLSSSNPRLNSVDLSIKEAFQEFIKNEKKILGSLCLWGGYLENRVIYKRSDLFGTDRSFHLGIDIWLPDKTKIYAPKDAHVIHVAFHNRFGDYGGTAILRIEYDNAPLYILYGHLSAHITNLKQGDLLEKGEHFANLGEWDENGNWPPHLHIQAIQHFNESNDDFPGVCSFGDLNHYKKLCPNPEFLL